MTRSAGGCARKKRHVYAEPIENQNQSVLHTQKRRKGGRPGRLPGAQAAGGAGVRGGGRARGVHRE
jgi:hypothetical protein